MENRHQPSSTSPRAEDRAAYEVPLDDKLQHSLAELDALKASLEVWRQRRPDVWLPVFQKLKTRWTTDSNAIEGSTLTFAETLFFLQHGLTVKGKPFKDHLDARNHAEAIELVFDAVADRRPITESFIKEINALILLGVSHTPARDHPGQMVQKPATPGRYKTWPNNVVQADGTIHYYVEPLQVEPQMQALCAWIDRSKGALHPAIVAALAHYNFVRFHPFDDGNGRGARILMNLILIQAGFPPAVLPATEREDHIAALIEADRGNVRPFMDFIASHTRLTMASLITDFEKAPPISGN